MNTSDSTDMIRSLLDQFGKLLKKAVEYFNLDILKIVAHRM